MREAMMNDDLQREYDLLSQRAQQSAMEADAIRQRMKVSQHALNEAEAQVEAKRQSVSALEDQLQSLTLQLETSRRELLSAQREVERAHEQTASIAEQLGPAAQKQKRFSEALATLEQTMGATPSRGGAPVPPPPPSSTQSEGRRPPRVDLKLELSFELDLSDQSGHNFYTGLTNNISEGGLFIATPQLFDIGTQLKFPFQLPNMKEAEDVEGIVRWVRREDRPEQGIPCGIGIQFT
jgi:uncharacterized protein (TIGR02266 family)